MIIICKCNVFANAVQPNMIIITVYSIFTASKMRTWLSYS